MRRKINFSIVILSFFAIISTMTLMGLSFNKLYSVQNQREVELLARFLSRSDMVYDLSEMEEKLKDGNFRVTVMDAEGNVLIDNHAKENKIGSQWDKPEIRQALSMGEGSVIRRSDTTKTKTFYFALLLEDGCILRVSRDADSIFRYIKAIIPSALVILLGLCLVSMTTAQILTKKLLKPIEELAENMDGNRPCSYYKELEPFVTRIREQHAGLLKSSKMRQEFTANVTHELKTPLTSISGYAELIENGMASGEDVPRFAGGIRKNSDRLLTLINDIIRLSELDDGEIDVIMEPLNLYQLAASCVEMLSVNAEKHNVTMSVQGEGGCIRGNRMMIEELLYNLCDNAIRYNNEGGSVSVDVRRDACGVVLCVSDTGIGIPKEHQERIFERFYRVDKSRSKSTGGTGLGLAIVNHIVEIHGAKMEVESCAGVGTSMRVIFGKCKS